MLAQLQIDPNDLFDTSGVGWEEAILAFIAMTAAVIGAAYIRRLVRLAVLNWTDAQQDVAVFLAKLASWFVIVLGIVAALMIVGFQLGPLFLLLGVIAVVLFLSARNLVENLGAGILIQAENPIHIGDLVEIVGETGIVLNIANRTTVIDTYDGRRVHLPNSNVLTSPIVNYTARHALRSEITIGLEYGTDLDVARAIMLEALSGVDGVKDEPKPEVLVAEFGDASIAVLVRFWHEPTQHVRDVLTDRVARTLDRSLREHGLVIAFPQVVVWRGDRADANASGSG